MAESLEIVSTDELFPQLFDELMQGESVIRSADNQTFVVRKRGNLPTFAHGVVAVDLFQLDDVTSAPKRCL